MNNYLIISALITLSIFIGGVAIWNENKVVKNDSEIMINAVCMDTVKEVMRLKTNGYILKSTPQERVVFTVDKFF